MLITSDICLPRNPNKPFTTLLKLDVIKILWAHFEIYTLWVGDANLWRSPIELLVNQASKLDQTRMECVSNEESRQNVGNVKTWGCPIKVLVDRASSLEWAQLISRRAKTTNLSMDIGKKIGVNWSISF